MILVNFTSVIASSRGVCARGRERESLHAGERESCPRREGSIRRRRPQRCAAPPRPKRAAEPSRGWAVGATGTTSNRQDICTVAAPALTPPASTPKTARSPQIPRGRPWRARALGRRGAGRFPRAPSGRDVNACACAGGFYPSRARCGPPPARTPRHATPTAAPRPPHPCLTTHRATPPSAGRRRGWNPCTVGAKSKDKGGWGGAAPAAPRGRGARSTPPDGGGAYAAHAPAGGAPRAG